jgi:hypothetical protein
MHVKKLGNKHEFFFSLHIMFFKKNFILMQIT